MGKTNKNIKGPLAVNIIRRRKALGYKSGLKFAEAVKIPYGTIRDIEAGYSEGWPETREAIAKFFKCSVSDLFSSDETKSINRPSLDEIATKSQKILDIVEKRLPDIDLVRENKNLKEELMGLREKLAKYKKIPDGLIAYLSKDNGVAEALAEAITSSHSSVLFKSFTKLIDLASKSDAKGSGR